MNKIQSSPITSGNQIGPVGATDRISSLDIIRGIALLGILMINIEIFSTPELLLGNPTLGGDFEGSNRVVWFIKQYLFKGKMWTLFSMLFGAGAFLLITRAEEKGRASGIADIYYRRLIFLLLFGLFHAYLVWSGDVLYIYALAGLFLFPLRKLSFGWMISLAGMLFALIMTFYLLSYRGDIMLSKEVPEIEAILEEGGELTGEQQALLDEWNQKVSKNKPDQEEVL